MIIPTLNEAAELPHTLNKLKSSWSGNLPEIIVVDGGSTDGTPQIAERFGAQVITAPAGRARQLNAGAANANSQWLYFLHADTLPPENLTQHLRSAAQNTLPAAFPIRFKERHGSFWLKLFSLLSRINVAAFRFGDQSLFVRQQDFWAVGGYCEEMSLMEGYELAARLRKRCRGFQLLNGYVATSARRYLHFGVLYTQVAYVLIFTLHQLGAGQATLLRVYRKAFPPERISMEIKE